MGTMGVRYEVPLEECYRLGVITKEEGACVRIVEIDRGEPGRLSAAVRYGVVPGLLCSVNGAPVASHAALADALSSARSAGEKAVTLVIAPDEPSVSEPPPSLPHLTSSLHTQAVFMSALLSSQQSESSSMGSLSDTALRLRCSTLGMSNKRVIL